MKNKPYAFFFFFYFTSKYNQKLNSNLLKTLIYLKKKLGWVFDNNLQNYICVGQFCPGLQQCKGKGPAQYLV